MRVFEAINFIVNIFKTYFVGFVGNAILEYVFDDLLSSDVSV